MADTDNELVADDGGEDKDPKWYRDQLKAYKQKLSEKDEKITSLGSQLMQAVVREVGLDVTQGPGKAVADFYQGDPEPSQVRDFAIQYGWQPPTPAAEGPAAQVREAQQRIGGVVGGAKPAEPVEIADQVRKAEAEGDWVTALRLKTSATKDLFTT